AGGWHRPANGRGPATSRAHAAPRPRGKLGPEGPCATVPFLASRRGEKTLSARYRTEGPPKARRLPRQDRDRAVEGDLDDVLGVRDRSTDGFQDTGHGRRGRRRHHPAPHARQ